MPAALLAVALALAASCRASGPGSIAPETAAAARRATPAAPPAPVPVAWRLHVGTQADAYGRLGSVRGVGRGLTGKQAPDGGAGLLGHAREAAAGGRDLVLPVGGLDSARDPAAARRFLAADPVEGAKAWRETARRQALALESLPGTTVAWQIGNEINSMHWSRALLGRDAPDDPDLLPVYVERYLRPAAEGIREADAAGGARHLVVLGSVANARRAGARAWMESLLGRALDGDAAGRTVADVVDVASIHYLVTTDDEAWETHLDELFDRWVRSGRLDGIWSTEELGTRRAADGLGAATTLKVLGRYLSWWSTRAVTPLQSRCFLYGWQRGTAGARGEDALALLDEITGGSAVVAVAAGSSVEAAVPVEMHVFGLEGRRAVRFAILAWPEGAPAGAVVRVRTDVRATAVRATHFVPSGMVRPSATVEEGAVIVRIESPTPEGSASLLVLDVDPVSGAE